MKCPLCRGRGTEELPDAYGREVLCVRCKGAGEVRGYEEVVNREPIAPPIQLKFERARIPTYRIGGRRRLYLWKAIKWLRSPVLFQGFKLVERGALMLDRLLERLGERVWPHFMVEGSPLDYELPISKIIENQSIQDIKDIEDQAFLDQVGKVIQ